MAPPLDSLDRILDRAFSLHGAPDPPSGPAPAPSELKKQAAIAVHLDGYHRFADLESLVRRGSHFRINPSVSYPCPPSVPLPGLRPISLAELELGKVHLGRVLIGSLCVDAFIVSGIMTVLQDDTDPRKAIRLSIYNAAPSHSTFADVQKLFPKGMRIALKEPYLKRSNDGYLGLRVDNPGNIEKLVKDKASSSVTARATHVDDGIKGGNGSCDNGIKGAKAPPDDGIKGRKAGKGCQAHNGDDGEDPFRLRLKGNSLFAQANWNGAIACYSKCLNALETESFSPAEGDGDKKKEARLLAFSNRAEAWMKVGNYLKALQDCDHALSEDAGHLKSLFRRGRALHGLERFQEACACFEALIAAHPDYKEVRQFLLKSQQAVSDQLTKLSGSLESFLISKTPPPKCPDFIGPVVVKMSKDSGGRGLFASENVNPGDILLISNAMAICKEEPVNVISFSMDKSSRRITTSSQEDLVTKLASLGIESPRFLRSLYCLCSSSSCNNTMGVPHIELLNGVCIDHKNANEQVDITRIREIVRLNSFGVAGHPFLGHKMKKEKKKANRQQPRVGSGLWLLPSFINHSCIPNAAKLHIGDAMLIHATANISAGEEITISYFNSLIPLKLREEACDHWGFQCSCKRCIVERSVMDSLENISSEVCSLHGAAKEEFIAAMSTMQDLPPELFPICFSLSRLFEDAREKIKGLPDLSSLEKKWVLASYACAFLPYWLISFDVEKSALDEVTLELKEAMVACEPASWCTLSFVAKLAYVASMDAQMWVWHRSGEKGRRAVMFGEEAKHVCLCAFGKRTTHVLEQLVELCMEKTPLPFKCEPVPQLVKEG